jgi:16S rRNA (cytosine967-C5)-methyltransferase
MSDEVEDLLVLAAATLYPESPNHYPAHTLVNETVKAASDLPKIAHAKGMINAVLRRLIEHPQDFDILLNRHQNHYPQWWTYKLQRAYPKEWQKILKTNLFPAKLFVRVNPKVFTREEYLEELRKVNISALEIPAEILKLAPQAICLEQSMPISKLPHFSSGGVCIQDLGAQMAGHLLSPKDGEDVLDACAAPGGKSTHLLELANISLTALEINQGRLAKVNENITRLGLSAKLLVGDASKPELWWDKKQFDRILADTPCSATGIIRRHPDILYLRRESDFVGLKITQQQILRSLWDLLKPGGELLYVSCSIFPEEGEEQIQLFLEEHPNALRLNSLNQL